MVQDQKVLSEVPNRAVLPSVFSAVQFKKKRYVRPEYLLHGYRIFVAEHVMPVFVLNCFSKGINMYIGVHFETRFEIHR